MPTTAFIMIDGLRPEAIRAAPCRHLAGVVAQGSATLRASSVMPSITLPCHASIFHSLPPERHGVTTNDWRPMARPVPGLMDLAHAAGKRCAAFYNWEPLRNLSQPGSLRLAYFTDSAYTRDGDVALVGETVRLLSAAQAPFDFVFVYLGTVDTAGHDHGWLSDEYLKQAALVDGALGQLLAALPADSAVLIQSDHGGHERTHGTDSADDMTIPWVVAGPGLRRGHALTVPVSLLDTAPTLARLMGLAPHPQWEGRVIEEAFEARP
jgi:predicted AlkP superfamily pyrophosphatase or phosphodiesterase